MERAIELEMSGEAPRVPILDSPGDLPLRETSELRAAGPVLLTALQPLRQAVTWAAATARQQCGVLLHLLELVFLQLGRLLFHRVPEKKMHAATNPVADLPLSIPVITLITRNALQIEDVDEVLRLSYIGLYSKVECMKQIFHINYFNE